MEDPSREFGVNDLDNVEGELTRTPELQRLKYLKRAARNGSHPILAVVVFGSIKN